MKPPPHEDGSSFPVCDVGSHGRRCAPFFRGRSAQATPRRSSFLPLKGGGRRTTPASCAGRGSGALAFHPHPVPPPCRGREQPATIALKVRSGSASFDVTLTLRRPRSGRLEGWPCFETRCLRSAPQHEVSLTALKTRSTWPKGRQRIKEALKVRSSSGATGHRACRDQRVGQHPPLHSPHTHPLSVAP